MWQIIVLTIYVFYLTKKLPIISPTIFRLLYIMVILKKKKRINLKISFPFSKIVLYVDNKVVY